MTDIKQELKKAVENAVQQPGARQNEFMEMLAAELNQTGLTTTTEMVDNKLRLTCDMGEKAPGFTLVYNNASDAILTPNEHSVSTRPVGMGGYGLEHTIIRSVGDWIGKNGSNALVDQLVPNRQKPPVLSM